MIFFCLAIALSAASLQKIVARDGGILAKNDDRGFFKKGVQTWRESDI
jgi:hypothetical protein